MEKIVPDARTIILNCLAVFGLAFLWTLVLDFFTATALPEMLSPQTYRDLQNLFAHDSLEPKDMALLGPLVLGPFLEEFLCRAMPIGFGRWLDRGRGWAQVPLIIVISVILFGWLHGGPQYIVVCGVIGYFLARLYTMNGGGWRGYLSCVVTHAALNFKSIVLVSLMIPRP